MTQTSTNRLYSFEEYLAYDDGTDSRYELVDGKLEVMNPPTFRHLLISDFIQDNFKAEIKRLNLPGLCFREAGVRTGWRKSRLPDVYVVASEQVMEFLDESAVCQSAPLLVVEVVSLDSIKRDYRHKRSEYAALEVPEYWIVDPIQSKITILILSEGLYEEQEFSGSQQIVSATFSEIRLTVEQVLSGGKIG